MSELIMRKSEVIAELKYILRREIEFRSEHLQTGYPIRLIVSDYDKRIKAIESVIELVWSSKRSDIILE